MHGAHAWMPPSECARRWEQILHHSSGARRVGGLGDFNSCEVAIWPFSSLLSSVLAAQVSNRMARSAAWILLLCAIAAGAEAKTLPVATTRRHGAPTPASNASAPLQARAADLPVLGAVGNIIGGDSQSATHLGPSVGPYVRTCQSPHDAIRLAHSLCAMTRGVCGEQHIP